MLYDFIDQSRHEEAEELYKRLLARWGDLDPELIRSQDDSWSLDE